MLTIVCAKCGRAGRIPEAYMGHSVRCKACGSGFQTVPPHTLPPDGLLVASEAVPSQPQLPTTPSSANQSQGDERNETRETHCPYCMKVIDPPPKRSRKCPFCREPIVLRRKRLMTHEQARLFDEERKEKLYRELNERNERIGLYIRARNTLQPKIDAGIPCTGEEASLYLSHTEFQSQEAFERAKRLLVEGRFEEGKSVPWPEPREGWDFLKTYPCNVDVMFPGIYMRPFPDGSIGFWREKSSDDENDYEEEET